MKKIEKFRIIFLIAILPFGINAQNWSQKSDLTSAGRYSCVGFSIDAKGYIGLGNDIALTQYNDFWEWDQGSNTWTQRSNFPGLAREGATGFSIDKRGYVVNGYGSSGVKELWEWDGDPASATYNTWTRKTDFPGSVRIFAVAFTIGKKGYVGTGAYTKDFWEWDGDTASATYDTWTRKADFGGVARGWATGFAIGNKGYIGTGTDGSSQKRDFWEWDGDSSSATYDTWVQIADLPGAVRSTSVGFSMGNKGYVGTGFDINNNINLQDFWEWDQASNTWTQKPDFPGTGRQAAVGFAIGNRGYIGTGYDNTSTKDFWEYCDNCSVGIDEFKNTALKMYPNPANELVTFVFQKAQLIKTVEIFSLDGRLMQSIVLNTKLEELPLDLSNYNTGVYFIKLCTANEVWIKKVVVQK